MKFPFRLFTILPLFLMGSCETKNQKQIYNTHHIKVFEAKGFEIPKDSIAQPKIVPVVENQLKKIPCGKPSAIPANSKVCTTGTPKVVLAGSPKSSTPGKDTFLLPKTFPVPNSPFVSGVPEVVVAKDGYTRDQNPENFRTFGKLQGLKHGQIMCMTFDMLGNLWLGTHGGGVSKYDGKNFTHFTDREGLSNNDVRSILLDKRGNLWFGTNGGGVTKYDGKNFTHFTEKEGLANNIVLCIGEEKNGNIWFGTSGGGATKYDGRNFTNYTVREGLCNNDIRSIIQDKAGNLWFGTAGGGVSRFDGKNFFHFTEKEGLSHNFTNCILEDSRGNIWFGTGGGGVSKYEPPRVKQAARFTHYTEKEGLSHHSIWTIFEDKSGNIWFGTFGGGITKYEPPTSVSVAHFTHFTESEGLSNNLIRSIVQDKSGNLWFGTEGGGLSKYDGKIFTHFTEKEGLSNNIVTSILQEENGNLWFGTYLNGVSKYETALNDNKPQFKHFTQKEGLNSNIIRMIKKDKEGSLWFATAGQGVSKYEENKEANKATFTYFTEQEGLANNDVYCMLQDFDGNFWFGTSGGGVSRYEPPKNGQNARFVNYTTHEGLSSNYIVSMLQDKSGNLWFGTYGGGLTKYSPSKLAKGEKFTHYPENENFKTNSINSIVEDKKGNLWLATANGVFLFITESEKIIHLTEKEGLSNNAIFSILEDKKGNIWFGTRSGLCMLSAKKLTNVLKKEENNLMHEGEVLFKNYAYEDGFLGIGCMGKSILEAKNGTIWIGTNDRLTAYHPEGANTDTTAPNIQLTNLGLFNEIINWSSLLNKKDSIIRLGNGVQVTRYSYDDVSKWYSIPKNLSLSYNNNYLTFKFIGITMNQPQKVKYKYILEGNDKNWSALTLNPEAHYGNLPHGTYTFKVKAMSSEGVWSKPLEYTFSIRPPWWKTWWAYSFYAITAIGGLIAYIQWRERSLKRKQKELETKVNEATQVMRKQKDEVEKQKDLAERQKEIAEHRKKEVEEKNREILDSINYAKRIQTAILPPSRIVKGYLKNSFILYLPKDIVAGDFYWMEGMDDFVYFAACDCTGHGVPGAMVSVVCNNALNRSINEFGERLPGKILDKTRELVLESFAKSDEEVKDGMDASLAMLNTKTLELKWSGANNPIWIFRRNTETIEEIKADKQPIGKGHEAGAFTTHEITVQSGDTIYLFTDGYADQFGGEKGRKLTKGKFRNFLMTIVNLPMEKQRDELIKYHDTYRANEEQVDDICVIGVRV